MGKIIDGANSLYNSLDNFSIKFLGDNIKGFLLNDPAQSELKNYIDDIPLDWSVVTTDSRSSQIKTKNLENAESTLITSNVSHENRKISLDIELAPETLNRLDIYEELIEKWKYKKLVTISGFDYLENMQIVGISSPIENINKLKFSMDFEQIEFATMKREGDIDETLQTQMKDPVSGGLQGTSQSPIEVPKGALL